ncbi:nitroreductase family protein [Chloroflexota bacterium]
MTNPVINSLLNHRSIRKFKPEPIAEDTLNDLLYAGVRAASAGNMQQYSLIVVDDPAKKKELLYDPAFADAAIVVVAVVDQYRMKRWLALNDAPFYNDQLANVFIPFWDATIALQNMVVAAESLGLGTVYIGGSLCLDMQTLLGTPEYVMPAGMVCIGWPDEEPELRPRLPLAAVVHRNGYHTPTDDEVRAYHQDKDASWGQLPAERKQALAEKGITNIAQMRTLGHYTPEFTADRSAEIMANLRRAGFRLPDEEVVETE